MVILGVVVEASAVPALTRDFLALKRMYFPGRYASGRALDHILVEIKGGEILQMTRSGSRNLRRQAEQVRKESLAVLIAHDCRVIGRVWIKESGKAMDPTASNCYAVQDLSRHFCEYLTARGDSGVVMADGRSHTMNLRVAHSIFTQKWRTGGDPYATLSEVPLFAASDNHAGLQIADMVASTLVFPMAAAAYAPARPGNPHSSVRYADVRATFGAQLRSLQHRYRDENGRWRGGIVVSDPVGGRSGTHLFS